MEFNVDRHIKTYWDKFVSLTEENENEEFVDATSKNSVRASRFLEHLNLDSIMHELNKYYSVKEGEERYPRRAKFKTMVWRKIKKIKYFTRAENHIKNYPEEAIELGFNIDLNGRFGWRVGQKRE